MFMKWQVIKSMLVLLHGYSTMGYSVLHIAEYLCKTPVEYSKLNTPCCNNNSVIVRVIYKVLVKLVAMFYHSTVFLKKM